jgi:hemerythrin-like domain-containing protein
MVTRQSRRGGIPSRRSALVVLLAALAAAATAGAAFAARRRRVRIAEATPAEVGFMLAMHNAFRRDLTGLAELVGDVGTAPSVNDRFRREWSSFRDRLHRHHAAEDDDLWPVLRARLTSAADLASVDQMVEEHYALSAAMDAVDQAVSAPHNASDGRELTAVVDQLSRIARDHLDHEERDVLPLVETHLSRADWRSFLVTERRQTPLRERPDFLGWVLDDAGPDDVRAVLAELPPPGRLAYRYVIGPRYHS